ncbi:MAG: hypothetical protein ACJ76I_01360 [Gaiellaceae bacterium]
MGVISVALLYLGIRLWMFWPARAGLGAAVFGDAGEYLRVARLSLFSAQFSTEHKPVGYPLILKVFGEWQEAVVWMQLLVSVASWLFLAAVIIGRVPTRFGSLAAGIVLLGFSCAWPVSQWDTVLLTESLSVSFFVILIGIGVLCAERPRRTRLACLFATALAFSSLRDVNGVIAAVMLLLVAASLFRGLRPGVVAYIATAAATCMLLVVATSSSSRWQVLIADQIDKRVMLDPVALAFFRERGMPAHRDLSAVLYSDTRSPSVPFNAAATLRRDPRLAYFLPWFMEHGNETYKSYLLHNPAASIGVPTRRFPLILSDAGLDTYRASGFRALPTVVEHLVYPSSGRNMILLELSMGGFALLGVSRRIFTRSWVLPLGLMLSGLPLAIFVWDGEPSEVPRHALLVGVGSRLGLWLGCFIIVAPVVSACRKPRSARANAGQAAVA